MRAIAIAIAIAIADKLSVSFLPRVTSAKRKT